MFYNLQTSHYGNRMYYYCRRYCHCKHSCFPPVWAGFIIDCLWGRPFPLRLLPNFAITAPEIKKYYVVVILHAALLRIINHLLCTRHSSTCWKIQLIILIILSIV